MLGASRKVVLRLETTITERPNILRRSGVYADFLSPGETVRIEGYFHRSGCLQPVDHRVSERFGTDGLMFLFAMG